MDEKLQAAAAWLWHEKRGGASLIDALLAAGDEEQALAVLAKIRQKNELEQSFEQMVSEGKTVIAEYLEMGIRLLFAHAESHPNNLYAAHSSMPIVAVKGNVDLLHRRQIAVVGSRHPTEAGVSLGALVVNALLSRGFIITSGGALGIDALAHREAMKHGQPTIVVTATDVTKVYPKENEDIYAYASQYGAVVSQFPRNTPPRRELFPVRNGLMAALSEATCIVQCREKSGALYTAEASRAMKRPVFVVAAPGFSSASEGGLELVKNHKAQLVSTALDLDCLGRGDQNAKGVQKQLGLQMLFDEGDAESKHTEATSDVSSHRQENTSNEDVEPRAQAKNPYQEEPFKHAIYEALQGFCLGREEIGRRICCFDLTRLNEALFDMECDGSIINLAGGYRIEHEM